MSRVIVIIMDGFGVGALPDADLYQDLGSNTLLHISESIGQLDLPNLEKFGLGKIIEISGLRSEIDSIAAFGKMKEQSPGKDSVTGHWEISGIELSQPFPTYPNGFPKEIISKFEKQTGFKTIGNRPASGTQIIKELGEMHISTGHLIVYTSADSVFQIAAHEDIVPVDELYRCCEVARKLLNGEHRVGRVIARPFVGTKSENFTRTKYRKDYSVLPPEKTIFDYATDNLIATYGIGKIDDLFGGQGIKFKINSKGNRDCIKDTLDILDSSESGLIMTNLVDFDMLFGHQRDINGYYNELINFDNDLENILKMMRNDDLLLITSDHGNDPTHFGSDHTREYVPLFAYHKNIEKNINLKTRNSFADVGATIAEFFNIKHHQLKGESFYHEIY